MRIKRFHRGRNCGEISRVECDGHRIARGFMQSGTGGVALANQDEGTLFQVADNEERASLRPALKEILVPLFATDLYLVGENCLDTGNLAGRGA